MEPTDPFEQHLLHAPKLADPAFDFDHAADVDAAEIDGVPARRHAPTLALPLAIAFCVRGFSLEVSIVDFGLDDFATCDFQRGAAAIVEDHDPSFVVFVKRDDDADEADPLDWVVEVEVDFLACGVDVKVLAGRIGRRRWKGHCQNGPSNPLWMVRACTSAAVSLTQALKVGEIEKQ